MPRKITNNQLVTEMDQAAREAREVLAGCRAKHRAEPLGSPSKIAKARQALTAFEQTPRTATAHARLNELFFVAALRNRTIEQELG